MSLFAVWTLSTWRDVFAGRARDAAAQAWLDSYGHLEIGLEQLTLLWLASHLLLQSSTKRHIKAVFFFVAKLKTWWWKLFFLEHNMAFLYYMLCLLYYHIYLIKCGRFETASGDTLLSDETPASGFVTKSTWFNYLWFEVRVVVVGVVLYFHLTFNCLQPCLFQLCDHSLIKLRRCRLEREKIQHDIQSGNFPKTNHSSLC